MSPRRQNTGVLQWAPARVTTLCALLAALAVAVAAPVAAGQASAACGASTVATLATVDAMVATNIDHGELGGSETEIDLGHVASAPALLGAVAADDVSATLTAVKQIVYHHFWHIVRLRVLDTSGRVLADVGGPDVIAPVTGVLRSAGSVIGSFVMSVQDDVGFAKLERRAIGDPIGIYVNGARVTELGGAFPKSQPSGASVKLSGVLYSTDTLAFGAFPNGTLDAVIALSTPSATLKGESCTAVGAAEIGRVAERLALRFHPLAASYGNFVETVHADTGAIVVVRIGLRTIAGSEGLGPATLPNSGAVSYEGSAWSVFSFAPTPPARIYLLISQA